MRTLQRDEEYEVTTWRDFINGPDTISWKIFWCQRVLNRITDSKAHLFVKEFLAKYGVCEVNWIKEGF
jgi:hypothetical protein